MIQRIQSLYLLLAAGITGGLIFVFNLWENMQGELVYAIQNKLFFALFMGSTAVSLLSILMFKNRKLQFILGRLNIIINFVLLGFFVYQSLNVSGEILISKKGIGMLFPVLTIVLLALANKAIKKDEDLVKSVDRLR